MSNCATELIRASNSSPAASRSLPPTVVVLLTNGWAVWQPTRNRAETFGGKFQLTEHELPLQHVALESSVTVLGLNWKTDRISERFGPAAWLNTNKLAALGIAAEHSNSFTPAGRLSPENRKAASSERLSPTLN